MNDNNAGVQNSAQTEFRLPKRGEKKINKGLLFSIYKDEMSKKVSHSGAKLSKISQRNRKSRTKNAGARGRMNYRFTVHG